MSQLSFTGKILPPERPASPRLSAEQRDQLPNLVEAFQKTALFITNTTKNPDPGLKAVERAIDDFLQIDLTAKHRFGDKGRMAMAIGLDLNKMTFESLAAQRKTYLIYLEDGVPQIYDETPDQKSLRKDVLTLLRKTSDIKTFGPNHALETYTKAQCLIERFKNQPEEWRMRCAVYHYDYLTRFKFLACRERVREQFLNNKNYSVPPSINLTPDQARVRSIRICKNLENFGENLDSMNIQQINNHLNDAYQIFYLKTGNKNPIDWDAKLADRFYHWSPGTSDSSRPIEITIGTALLKRDMLEAKEQENVKISLVRPEPKSKAQKKKKANSRNSLTVVVPNLAYHTASCDPDLVNLNPNPGHYTQRIHAATMEDSISGVLRPVLRRLNSTPGRIPDWKAFPPANAPDHIP